MKRNRRRIKLINKRLQLRLIAVFVSVACASVLVQSIVLNWTLLYSYGKGEQLVWSWPGLLWMNVLLTFALLVPATIFVGIRATFRIAGPLYRLELHMRRILSGEQPGPCSLRKGDELHEFCDLLNETVDYLRSEMAATGSEEAPTSKAA